MHLWLPASPQPKFAFTTQRVVIDVPGGTSDCPEPKTFKIFFHQKNTHRNTHWQGEVIRDSPGLKDLALSWWIGARFFDAGEICELRLHTVSCLASHYVGKQHRTNNELQNRIKWSYIEPRLHRKSTNKPKFTWWNLFLYLFLYFYVFTTILFFHTIVICKAVRGNLCTDIMLPVIWLNISKVWVCNVTRWTTDTKICRGGGRKEFPKLLHLSVKNTSSSESLISFW